MDTSNIFTSNEFKENRQLINKAANLVQSAKVKAIGFQLPLLHKFPQLRAASQLNEWNFLCTVMSTYSGYNKLRNSITNEELIFTKLESMVISKLNEFHDNGEVAFNDFGNFLNDQ